MHTLKGVKSDTLWAHSNKKPFDLLIFFQITNISEFYAFDCKNEIERHYNSQARFKIKNSKFITKSVLKAKKVHVTYYPTPTHII